MKAKLNRNLWPYIEEAATPMTEYEESSNNYPSQIEKLLSCMLRVYWDKTDRIPEDFSHLTMTFAHGNAIHSMLVDFIKRAGIWRGDEVRGSNLEFSMSYRIDCLIADPTNNGKVVPVEIKSVKASSWNMVKNEPFLSHYLQLQMYLHFHKPEPYEYGYIIYYNKNEDLVRTFMVEHDAEICAQVEAAIKEVEERIRKGEPPSPPESTEPCRWCQYKSRCFEDGETNTWLF